MTIPTLDIEALDRAYVQGKLEQGDWGNGTRAVCMMSALVPGARSADDCVTAGWPKWLVELNVYLFDDAPDAATAYRFARDIAKACTVPIQFDRARDLFLIAVLSAGKYSALDSLNRVKTDAPWWHDSKKSIETIVTLLQRRSDGADVATELEAARDAAGKVAGAPGAVDAAWNAVDLARDAVDAAAYAARDAARAAADAARAAADAARKAARAAKVKLSNKEKTAPTDEYRTHLIHALREAAI